MKRWINKIIYMYKFGKVKYIYLKILDEVRGTKDSNSYLYEKLKNAKADEYENLLTIVFGMKTGKKINLKNPQTFNEKIQWTKLHGITPRILKLTDKYLVREWVKEYIGEQYLIPLLGVWDRFEDIDIDKLPNSFVLKCNHGSGWNDIVKDKNKWNYEETKCKFDKWMNLNFAYMAGYELQYKDIVPKIIAEQYIEDINGKCDDYKFLCFNGKVAYFWIDTERVKDHRRDIFDVSGKHVNGMIGYANADSIPELPSNINEMIKLAEKLSEGFPHVRVDLYSIGQKIYFGEMTFTSGNGMEKIEPIELEEHLGCLFGIKE